MTGYINDGSTQYALTKGGTTLKINGGGENVTMTGGGDIEQNVAPAEIFSNPGTGRKSIYDSDNGRTFFIDKVLQDPTKSVYTVLGEHNEYTMFFDLLKGNEVVFSYFQSHGDKDVVPVFDLKKTTSSSGLGYVVNSFNNFRYTVFIPTEAALNKAFSEDEKLYKWDEIVAETDYDKKKEMTLYLLKFLKYHFMDNSAYISGKPINGMRYETAARNESSKFHRLVINSDGSNMVIECEGIDQVTGQPIKANVVKTAGLYNLMARDYIMEGSDYMTATTIAASSRSVIHLIDSVLKFE